MFEKIAAWLGSDPAPGASGRGASADALSEVELAMAALLVEAAGADGDVDGAERTAIRRILMRRFGIPEADVAGELARAERTQANAAQLFGFARTINDRLDADSRVSLVEMLWDVALADGEIDPLEDSVLRRIAGLVEVSDHERGMARRRALARAGRSEDSPDL